MTNMNRVTVELWLWPREELKGDFQSPSDARSVREELVEEGTTVRDLLQSLASRYRAIEEHVFDARDGSLRPDVVANYNQRVVDSDKFYEQVLKDGDSIIIFQLYTGG